MSGLHQESATTLHTLPLYLFEPQDTFILAIKLKDKADSSKLSSFPLRGAKPFGGEFEYQVHIISMVDPTTNVWPMWLPTHFGCASSLLKEYVGNLISILHVCVCCGMNWSFVTNINFVPQYLYSTYIKLKKIFFVMNQFVQIFWKSTRLIECKCLPTLEKEYRRLHWEKVDVDQNQFTLFLHWPFQCFKHT